MKDDLTVSDLLAVIKMIRDNTNNHVGLSYEQLKFKIEMISRVVNVPMLLGGQQ